MGGAPLAAGLSFALLVRLLGTARAGALQAASSGTSILGSALTGLVLLPRLELDGALKALVLANALGATLLARRAWPLLVSLGLVLALPRWDRELFAVGVHLAVSEFADPSRAGVERYAREGWELVSYDHGLTGAVAVGRSLRSGNVWMSINGKFDASTGDDMPTQELSARLPLAWSPDPARVLVVGLASGVTAGTALEDPRLDELWLVEIEPAVVSASRAFDHVNRRPLGDPRTRLLVEDARAVLERPGPPFQVIISEPSNPWITGVSSLFTLEYWQAARARLAPGGVFCQWVQLYGMGREELRALLRTFLHVFPDARLYETIGGSDVLLIAGGAGAGPTDLSPLLGPEDLRRAAGVGWKNTDDHPLVEWRAPGWLHYDTGAANAAWLRGLAQPKPAP
jgi:spermidine synthase